MSVGIEFLRAAIAVLVAVFTFGPIWLMVAGGVMRPKTMGLRGVKRERALRESALFAKLDPWVRWFARRLGGFISGTQRARLERQLTYAGDVLGLHPEELVGVWALSAAGGLTAGALLYALADLGLFAVLLSILGLILPQVSLNSVIRRRQVKISRELPYAIDLLALSIGAGKDFAGAVRDFTEKSRCKESPLVEEFMLLCFLLQTGQTRRQALEVLCARVPIDAMREFVHSVIQAEERGNPLADTLCVQARTSRMRRTVRAEEAAAKAGVKMVMPMFMSFGCVMILVLGPALLELQSSF